MGTPHPGQTRKRRMAWQALCICCTLLVARYVYLQRQPERLPQIHLERIWGPYWIHEGQLYWILDYGHASALYVQSLAGGPQRQIVQEAPGQQISPYYSQAGMTLCDGFIVYATQPRPTGGSRATYGVSGGPSKIQYLGTFRPASNKPSPQQAAQEKRMVLKAGPWTSPPLRIRRVPIQGGPAQDVAQIANTSTVAAGERLFWIRPGPDERVFITRGNQQWNEVRGHSALMVTSLVDGSSRQICTDLFTDNYSPVGGADGFFWTQPHPFPDPRIDMFYCHAADAKVHRIGEYAAHAGFTAPIEYRGRLYWYASDDIGRYGALAPERAERFVSANVDGSDQRVLLSASTERYVPVSNLMVHQGVLYGLFTEARAAPASADRSSQRHYLCRIHPERADLIEPLCPLPAQAGNIQLDGHYVYFDLWEQYQSLLDRLNDDPSHIERRSVLYRIRLPE